MKTRALAVAVLLAAALIVLWPDPAQPAPRTNASAHVEAPAGELASGSDDDSGGDSGVEADRQEVVKPDGDASLGRATGTLEVVVLYDLGDDKREPVVGEAVTYRRAGADARLAPTCMTDERGRAVVAGLQPGRVYVRGARQLDRFGADIEAGQTATIEIVYSKGIVVRGLVVDESERPIAGASIEAAMAMLVGVDPVVLATTDDAGRFEIRNAFRPCLVGARARGYRPSPMKMAFEDVEPDAVMKFVLESGGGSVSGVVVDDQGDPIEGAIVCVGEGRVQGLGSGTIEDVPPIPALVRSDAEGRFVAHGVVAGDVPVWARAADRAPWRGRCSVPEHGTSSLRITMLPGGTLQGYIRSSTGEPVPKAAVRHGGWRDFEHVSTHSDGEGRFELRGLPTGEVKVMAEHDEEGRVETLVFLPPGRAVEQDLTLSRGLELRGRVTDLAGQPIEKVWVQAVAEDQPDQDHWFQTARTDESGRFSMPACPVGRGIRVEFTSKSIAQHVVEAFDPRRGPLDVVLERLERNVGIAGRVVDPDGEPLAGVRVAPRNDQHRQHTSVVTTEADGRFAFSDLTEGVWKLMLSHKQFPGRLVTSRALGGDERWDAGDLALERGGTAIIRPQSVPGEDLNFMIADTRSKSRWAMIPAPEPVTPVLRPGEYLLQAWGKQAAAQVVRFSIIVGQQTEILLPTEVGVRQRLEFVYGDEVTYGATLAVYSGADKIVDRWLATEAGKPWGYDLWLLPGTYRVTLSGKLRAEVTLTIGATEAAPVTIGLEKP